MSSLIAAKLTSNKTSKPPTLDKATRKDLVRRLWAETRQEWKSLTLGTLALIGSSVSNQALPRVMGMLLDRRDNARILTRSSVWDGWTPGLAWVVVGGGLASCVRTVLLSRAEDQMAQRLRQRAFESLLMHRDVEWFQTESIQDKSSDISSDNGAAAIDAADVTTHASNKTKTAESAPLIAANRNSSNASFAMTPAAMATVLNEDVQHLSQVWTTNWANLVRSTSAMVLSTYNMLMLDPALLGLSFSVVPLVGAAAMVLRKALQRTTQRQRDLATQMASFVEERFTHV
jgi:ABC-type multidrug transport system fused ATPase/permease subunit